MDALLHFLPQVWFVILGLFLFLYVILDGFDLGVGILSLTSSDPLLGLLLVWLLLRSLNREEERTPFIWTILIFLLTFIGLGLIVFPYIIPTQITIYQAAAAPSALVFMIIFVGFLIPIMLFYNIYQYVVFRGKVAGSAYGD